MAARIMLNPRIIGIQILYPEVFKCGTEFTGMFLHPNVAIVNIAATNGYVAAVKRTPPSIEKNGNDSRKPSKKHNKKTNIPFASFCRFLMKRIDPHKNEGTITTLPIIKLSLL